MLTLLLLVLAAVCFALAAASVGAGRVNLIALGLFFWVATVLIPALGA